jgi:cytochrome c-type biogenesis protein CcmH
VIPAYLGMAALLLLACLWLTRPYWRAPGAALLRRKAANVAVYRSRLAEIDAEAESGVIEAEAAALLKQELAARLLQDAELPSDAPAETDRRRWGAIAALVLLLAVFAGVFYWQQGSWRTQELVALAAADPGAAQQGAIGEMVDKLAAKLEQNPEDLEGWAMLGRSYFVMERYGDAARAYAEINKRLPQPEADLLVAEGESLGLSRDRDLMGRPQELFQQALKLDPENGKGLWYAGLAAAQARDLPAARDYWQRLSRQELPAELRQVLEAQLAQLAQALGEPAPPAAAAPARAEPAAAAMAAGEGPRLQVKVALSAELAAKAPPGSMLFVFAKAEQGPPMPLAVQRLPGAKLPLEVVLDDSMAMMPQLKLSQFDRWTVTARITAGGGVKAESGDWEGSRSVSRVESAQPIALTIDRVVP